MKHELSTFLSGCMVSYEFIYFAKELDQLAQAGNPNSTFMRFKDSDPQAKLRGFDELVGWPAIAMAASKPPAASSRLVVAVGPNGDYWELTSMTADERVGQIED